MKPIILVLLLVFFGGITAAWIVKKVQLNINCTGHLKRAADANSVEMAKSELKTAIDYLEEKGFTRGYTSVFYNTPDEDIAFFYNNLKASYQELLKVGEESSSLEKSNTLMKLRETLIDHGKEGDHVTCPNGLSRYPNNLLLGIMMTLACLGVGFIWVSLKS